MPSYEMYKGTVRGARRAPRLPIKKGEESVLLFLTVTYYIGLAAGSFLQCGSSMLSKYLTLFAGQYQNIIFTTNAFSCFRGLFLSFFLMLTLLFIFSLCSIGAPFILLMPFVKGLEIGVFTSYLYQTMHLKGLFANILLLWPHQVISAGIVIGFSLISLRSARQLFQITLGGAQGKESALIPILLRPYLVCCGINLIPIGYELLANFLFLPVFLK